LLDIETRVISSSKDGGVWKKLQESFLESVDRGELRWVIRHHILFYLISQKTH